MQWIRSGTEILRSRKKTNDDVEPTIVERLKNCWCNHCFLYWPLIDLSDSWGEENKKTI